MNTGPQRVAAFAIAAFALIIASDYEPIAPVAVAFAYLFLLSTLYLVGPVAFDRLQLLIVNPGIASTAGPGHSA